MSDNQETNKDTALYPPIEPISAGIKGRCPRCGQGKLFNGLLTVKPSCANCGLDYGFEDSGDGPVVFVLLIMGFLVIGLAFWMEVNFQPPFWLQALIWLPVAVIGGVALTRMLKGVLITLQFANKAKQGKLDRD
ncbi:DUF983 domain-containing protein [Rhizobium sp. L1K21]|uniref:DUF983 domain-containing protein n=1 Tax=Rhizobium sp. L1K21 TaxID=2954933 RepID=UPI002091E90B|nr:DUF983 domain-containing protein [Rhizobium sp. L1K21]MCO6186836.1 DUF983 domain-containing protein [Rhizobium sp. L1K21]